MLAFFHLDPLSRFSDHSALDFRLLDLLLRLFLAWRWVGWLTYWIPRWIVNRSWRILKRSIYHILTEVQANHIWPWFVLLLFECPNGRQCSLGISPHPDGIGTSWGWCTMSASAVGPAPIERLIRTFCLCSCCKWGCHHGTLWQKCWVFLLGSCWCKPKTWPVHWSIQKIWLDIQSGYNGSWRQSSTHCLFWSLFNGRHWSDRARWNVEPDLADLMILRPKIGDTDF